MIFFCFYYFLPLEEGIISIKFYPSEAPLFSLWHDSPDNHFCRDLPMVSAWTEASSRTLHMNLIHCPQNDVNDDVNHECTAQYHEWKELMLCLLSAAYRFMQQCQQLLQRLKDLFPSWRSQVKTQNYKDHPHQWMWTSLWSHSHIWLNHE